MQIAVVDIGKPGVNFGWAISGPNPSEGTDIDGCIEAIGQALQSGPLALGFEAPMFVPIRTEPSRLTGARSGESGKGLQSRPFSAGAGAAVLVTGLVIVPYILTGLRRLVPNGTASLDWRSPPSAAGHLLLFEAFVTNQRKTTDTRHVEDAKAAIAAYRQGMMSPSGLHSAVVEPGCFNLLGAMMLRTGWATDPQILSEPCLVVRG